MVVGMSKLQAELKDRTQAELVKLIIKQNGSDLNKRMKAQTIKSFVKGYSKPPHQTRQSISTAISQDGFTATVGAKTLYAPYLEYGTRRMEAEPFVKPALNEQAEIFERDMRRITR